MVQVDFYRFTLQLTRSSLANDIISELRPLFKTVMTLLKCLYQFLYQFGILRIFNQKCAKMIAVNTLVFTVFCTHTVI